MPKITEEKLNKRKALYLKHKQFLDDFYKFFKGSFVQKQAREIVLKHGYKYNFYDRKTDTVIKKPYTINIFNKAIQELEDLGLIRTKRYYKTNNKSISYCKPLLCLIFNVDNQAKFDSPSFSNTTNMIYDKNLFKGFVILNDKNYNLGNLNTMFKNNEELLALYKNIYNTYLRIHKLEKDETCNPYFCYKEFMERTEQVKKLKTNPTKKEKSSYDLLKNYNKYNYCNFETLHKRNIYLQYYAKGTSKDIIYVRYNLFCFENMNAEKLTKYIGDTIQTTIKLFGEIFNKNKISFEINLLFLNTDYEQTVMNEFKNNYYFDETKHKKITYCNSLLEDFGYILNNIKILPLNADITNKYREGNQRKAFDKALKNKINALEEKKES